MATITLSTLDTNAPREYHRYALIFGCPDEAVTSTRKALHEVIKKTVAELPVLAGNVSTGEDGKTEIHVTHQQIEQYKAKVVNTMISHADLCREKIAPRLLFRKSMTPLADRPAQGSAPASAFQANFLANGLVLVIYLHRQVADIHGIGTILRLMSEGLPERQLTEEDLILECAQASFHRENLLARRVQHHAWLGTVWDSRSSSLCLDGKQAHSSRSRSSSSSSITLPPAKGSIRWARHSQPDLLTTSPVWYSQRTQLRLCSPSNSNISRSLVALSTLAARPRTSMATLTMSTSSLPLSGR